MRAALFDALRKASLENGCCPCLRRIFRSVQESRERCHTDRVKQDYSDPLKCQIQIRHAGWKPPGIRFPCCQPDFYFSVFIMSFEGVIRCIFYDCTSRKRYADTEKKQQNCCCFFHCLFFCKAAKTQPIFFLRIMLIM